MSKKLIPVDAIISFEGSDQKATILTRYWTEKEAKRRGFNFFALIYLFGSISFFNPVLILHFLIPPIWMIVGPLVGYRVYKMFAYAIELKKGYGQCPACGNKFDITPFGELEAFTASCPQCLKELTGYALNAEKIREEFLSSMGKQWEKN